MSNPIPHSTSCPAYYRLDQGCRCDRICPQPDEGNDEHVFKFYVLAPEMAQEKGAAYLGVCDFCAVTEYFKDLPDDAELAGEGMPA